MTFSESELDNILLGQKNDIFNSAVHSVDCREEIIDNNFNESITKIFVIINLITFNFRLWNGASYGYKAKEILRRIEVACRNSRDGLHHAATAKRKDLDKAISTAARLADLFSNLAPIEARTPPSVVEQVCGLECDESTAQYQ